MSTESSGASSSVAGGVDYKTLFLGSCTLIVILGGGFYGVWSRGAEQAAETNRTTNAEQWDRIAKLEAGAIDARFEIYRLDQDVERLRQSLEVHTKVIRDLERAMMLLERGKR
jgi:hypothetical protein